jgi:hypothetical protein
MRDEGDMIAEPPRAAAPIELIRTLRKVFVYDASEYRKKEQLAFSVLERQATAAKAYACEQVIREIDATLRDWA